MHNSITKVLTSNPQQTNPINMDKIYKMSVMTLMSNLQNEYQHTYIEQLRQ